MTVQAQLHDPSPATVHEWATVDTGRQVDLGVVLAITNLDFSPSPTSESLDAIADSNIGLHQTAAAVSSFARCFRRFDIP